MIHCKTFKCCNKYSPKEIDEFVITVRVLSILCVICAHITSKTPLLSLFYANIGTQGVSVFLFISGLYYQNKKYITFSILLREKFRNILLPAIIAGAIVYTYTLLVNNAMFSLIGLILYILGYKTYLYFCTILFACMLIHYFFHSKKWLFIFMILNFISVILTTSGLIDYIINLLNITNYLNIFNWIGYFSLGYIIKQYYYDSFIYAISKFRYLIIFLFFTTFLLTIYFNIGYGYFTYFGWIMELIGILFFFSISTLKVFKIKLISIISKYTFQIYLYHIVIVGVIYKIFGKHSALLVFILTLILLIIGKYIAGKLKLGKLYNTLVGLRN